MPMPVRPGLVADPSCPFFFPCSKKRVWRAYFPLCPCPMPHANARAPYLRPCPRQCPPPPAHFFFCRRAPSFPLPFLFSEVGLVAPPTVRLVFFFRRERAGYAHAHARTLWLGGHPLQSVFFLAKRVWRAYYPLCPCPFPSQCPCCLGRWAQWLPLLPSSFLLKERGGLSILYAHAHAGANARSPPVLSFFFTSFKEGGRLTIRYAHARARARAL